MRRGGNRMTQSEVAELLGCGRNKIVALTKAGTIPHFTDPDSGKPYYLRATLEAWMRRAGELHAEKSNP